jgi:hypothetical protein
MGLELGKAPGGRARCSDRPSPELGPEPVHDPGCLGQKTLRNRPPATGANYDYAPATRRNTTLPLTPPRQVLAACYRQVLAAIQELAKMRPNMVCRRPIWETSVSFGTEPALMVWDWSCPDGKWRPTRDKIDRKRLRIAIDPGVWWEISTGGWNSPTGAAALLPLVRAHRSMLSCLGSLEEVPAQLARVHQIGVT